MRGLRLAIACSVAFASSRAHAEALPSGSMGLVFGAVAGTGADANRLGVGYILYPLSFHAAWQPMDSAQRIGWTIRWTTLFSSNYEASAAQVTSLETLQMDVTAGIRVRPGASPRRYLTARIGPALFRANQTIPPKMQRAFIGAAGSVGVQQYLLGTFLLVDLDLRYGLIGDGPSQIAFTAALSITGP
jgi:hypothetical protein